MPNGLAMYTNNVVAQMRHYPRYGKVRQLFTMRINVYESIHLVTMRGTYEGLCHGTNVIR